MYVLLLKLPRVQYSTKITLDTSRALGDMYKFDLDQRKWEVVVSIKGQSPAPRYNHGLASASGKLYVFGGQLFYGGERLIIRPIYSVF